MPGSHLAVPGRPLPALVPARVPARPTRCTDGFTSGFTTCMPTRHRVETVANAKKRLMLSSCGTHHPYHLPPAINMSVGKASLDQCKVVCIAAEAATSLYDLVAHNAFSESSYTWAHSQS